jgi:hypothetical protein
MNKPNFARVFRAGRAPGHVAALMGVAILISACGEGSIPTAPTQTIATPPPPPTTVTSTLSGSVSEMTAQGALPIRDARVTEMSSGRIAVTDPGGLYTIPGLSASTRVFSITADGYVTTTRTVTLSGDTRLDVQLERMESYTLSGVVFEMTAAGQMPIEGVEVYCDSCGSPSGHTFVHTDANGFYSLAWAMNGPHPLFVEKAGYDIFDPTGTLRDRYGRITATVRGDTRFDVQLVKR